MSAVGDRFAREVEAMQGAAYPLRDVLAILTNAADHLLNDHSCDTHGWELIGRARDEARGLLERLDAPDDAPQAPTRSLAEIGRDAARAAQREALLATLEACGWNMSEAARRLGSNSPNILRAVRSLLADEYAAAHADGRIHVGGNRTRVSTSLTVTTERGTVRE